ncbi:MULTISPECIES: phage portal protein [unclassified Aeromicrobium]|uniref:phage portal protein n=1 Tax=unclassified Aeromicrobium TaxID=2633570 RepID=UPI002889988B|nr:MULTISPECIES: phage portal protein [unclassified Aeromicrobium]
MFGRTPGRRDGDYPDPSPAEGHQPTGVTPPARVASRALPLTTAVSLVPVYRSLQILATVAGQCVLDAERDGREIARPPLVAAPDVNLTPSRFVKRSVVSLAATGKCYWRKYRFADGTVASYEVLNPLTTYPDFDTAGRRVYRTQVRRNGRMETLTLPASEVRHLKLLEVPGYDDGIGPIQAGRLSLAGAADLRDYAANWFQDSGVPNGVLSTDQQITPTIADQIRKMFKKGVENHNVAVLGYGTTYSPIMLKPEDAQWLQAQQFSVTDVARLFGIPASYLLAAVEGSNLTYQNLEQVDTQFARTTLMAYLNEIEDGISADLPGRQSAKFNLSALLRPDAFTRAKIDALYIDKKVLSPAYVAEREKFPLPEGTPADV